MDYMDIDEESNISARDSIENYSFENKLIDKISNDQKTNTIHSQEDSAIVDLTDQNGPAQAFENANCKVSSSSDRGKGIDFLSSSQPEKTVSARRVSGQRRLVRNGCISPHNIAKAKESAENNNKNSSEFGNRDLISEANDCFRIRGKGVINHYFSRKGPNAKATNFSSRNSNLGGQLGRSNSHHHAANTLNKRQMLVSNSSNHGLRILDPVIEVDDFTPEMRNNGSRIVGGSCSNDDESDFRAIQVEADEILARELQEELYNEVPVFGVDEFDSHIALAFQQEDDSHQSVFDRSHREFHPRGSSVTNSYRQTESSSSQNSSVRRDTEARVPTSTIVARLRDRFLGQPSTASSSSSSSSSSSRINSLFPPNMDVDMRIHILEALEELSDMEMFGDLQVDRDFNENDYEMLLALDENNRHFGATPAQINGLPQSTVQSENLEETCAICLDSPSTGDTLRHLPCLHRFHKDCIDPWLRRRTSCPVCKSSITTT